MEVQMKDRLSRFPTIVDHESKAVIATLLVSQATGHVHQVSQQGLVLCRTFAQHGQALPVLGNDQNVHRCHGVHIPKGQDGIIFVHLVARNVPGHNLVKDCHFALVGGGGGTLGVRLFRRLHLVVGRRRRHVVVGFVRVLVVVVVVVDRTTPMEQATMIRGMRTNTGGAGNRW